jgi:hypothetical protein
MRTLRVTALCLGLVAVTAVTHKFESPILKAFSGPGGNPIPSCPAKACSVGK